MELLASDKDFTTSVIDALDNTDYQWRNYKGLIICGSHTPSNVEEKIEKIKEARRDWIPFLGICFGFQLMAIEYSRNVLGKWKANSTELNLDTDFPIVIKLNDPPGYTGETARRVGMKPIQDLWGNTVMESHWHNYKFNNEYLGLFANDWKFTQAYDPDLGEYIVELLVYKPAVEMDSVFMGVQFHPEYQSSKKKPHWVFEEFLKIAKFKSK